MGRVVTGVDALVLVSSPSDSLNASMYFSTVTAFTTSAATVASGIAGSVALTVLEQKFYVYTIPRTADAKSTDFNEY
jgi:hypothetical protein